LDQSADISTTTVVGPNTSSSLQTSHATTQTNAPTPNATSSELLMIKDEIQQLKMILAMAVAQITQALALLQLYLITKQ